MSLSTCINEQTQIELKNMAWMNLSLPTPVTLTTLPSLRWCNALLWITDLMIPILAWQVYSLVYSNLNLITFFFNKIFLYLSIRSSFSPLQSPFNNYKCVLDFLGGDSFTYQRKKTEREEVISRDRSNSPASLAKLPPFQLLHEKYSQEGNRVWHLLMENL